MHFKCLTALCLLTVSLAARAVPVTYTESAVASGSLNGVNFTNVLVTLTGTGDTTAVVQTQPGLYQNFLELQGTVAGLGTFTFTPPTNAFSNESVGAVGFSGIDGDDILDTLNAAFDTYDLETAIGPTTGESIINSGFAFATSDGNFDLTSAGNATFQATVGAATTPEPSSFLLLGTGLLGAAGAMRRRLAA